MKRLAKVAWCVLLFAPLYCKAQVGLYTAFSTTHISAASEPRLYGVTLGGYYDKQFTDRLKFVSLGPDFRLSLQSGTVNSGVYQGGPAQSLISVMAGPRVAFQLPVKRIHPYLEGLLGGADSQIGELKPDGPSQTIGSPNPRLSQKNAGGTLEWQSVGGLDLSVSHHIDWRVVEFSYGQLFLATGGTPNLGITTLSTGIVVRLP